MSLEHYRYTGSGKKSTNPAKNAYTTFEPYKPAANMIEAVNLAILLERPVLLEGEAGSGKSRLARAVAYELGLPLETWTVRSNSKASEGLYRFDALKRLYDVEMLRADLKPLRNPENPSEYIEFGQLGKAFKNADSPSVVLIDEIDKADLDFPNDLLNVLEQPYEFDIPESSEKIVAKYPPIVLITSNKEKGNLPAPFLRRCIYCYVRFPSDIQQLREIVDLHRDSITNQKGSIDEDLVDAALTRFAELRQSKMFKRPGTSELLDWLTALHLYNDKPYPAATLRQVSQLPYLETLYKLQSDLPEKFST